MIKVDTLVYNPFQENTYILSDETLQCVIVDPGCLDPSEENDLVEFIRERNLVPVCVVNTHLHLDHVFGNRFVSEHYHIPILANQDDEFQLSQFQMTAQIFGVPVNQDPPALSQYIGEGDVIRMGNSELIVKHVPGHSPGSIVLHHPESKVLISGDVLFCGSIGRTDLPKGNHEQLIEGISKKLMVLDGETRVYPGHGPSTLIKHEKAHNPFFN